MIRTSRIPSGVVVEGQIRGQGDLVIAGQVEGSLDIDGLVVIEASGQVRGPIRARAITVSGSVHGPLLGLARCLARKLLPRYKSKFG